MMDAFSSWFLFYQGYKQRNAYIATQCPLVGTVDTFWRMIWDYKSAVIVTLCSAEQDKQVCSTATLQFGHFISVQDFLQYWPTGETDYGEIKVKLIAESSPNGYFNRKFTIAGKVSTCTYILLLMLQFC